MADGAIKPLNLKEACADGSPPPPLVIGDRIVWISDNGPEYGQVKWLGKLPDVSNDWMAGVDFDNPVGSGTGLYNDHQLFTTEMNHASLVPVIGLMKAQDFLGAMMSSIASAAAGEAPMKPKRKAKKEITELTTDGFLPTSLERLKLTELTTTTNDIRDSHHSTTKSSSASETRRPKLPPILIPSIDDSTTSSVTSSANSHVNGTNDCLGFEVGSVVEVPVDSNRQHGVIRWIGVLDHPLEDGDDDDNELIAGVEMEDDWCDGNDGSFNGKRYFDCCPGKGYFVKLRECKRDSRFSSASSNRKRSDFFGSIDCPSVVGDVAPLSTKEDLQALCGKNRGIQGHHNSCYLDATLFAMFSCTTIFESLLHRPPRPDDIPEYREVQRVLKEEIVNPLRQNFYVRADRVMHLRKLLEKISSVRGLTSEEKDPEEFINLLLNEILKADPFLKLSSGLESFFYQLFVEKDEKLQLPLVQQLFDQSFLASDIKLREVPPCLLIQMPRFGRQFKMYPRIVPNLYLDITDVLENSPRQCAVCGQLAEYECKECFGQFSEGLESIAFCNRCLDKSHSHKKRAKHKTTKLKIPPEFNMLKEHTQIPRIYMELFAVLCIETSHYVSFVKCGSGPDSPWCFFDSMADRKGEQNGYNIPEIVPFPDLQWWLGEEGINFLMGTKDDKLLPEMPRRLLCDAYICWYASDVLRYR